jgi:cytosine/adenosine deaminase-related metal-dependent hydrolase
MDTLVIKPEFFVDYDGIIHNNSLVIKKGQIVAFGHDGYDDAKVLNLPNQAILPGFLNCHSHVFQRALRGLMEQKILHSNHFFTWRDRMYGILKNLGNDELALLAQLTYMEMLEAGFTHVGEFHYLHHDRFIGKTPLESSQKLAEAAKKTQINLILLECAYNRCDFDKPIQKNFLIWLVNHTPILTMKILA